jgi:hypothetical protein
MEKDLRLNIRFHAIQWKVAIDEGLPTAGLEKIIFF